MATRQEDMLRVATRWLQPVEAYDNDPSSMHMLDQQVHADELGTALDSADGLEDELFPQSADVLIEDHEKARGIQPDDSKTLAQRRADVQWKWQGPGGAKPSDLQAALKRKMGYEPRVIEMLQADLDDGWRGDDEYRMYRFYVLADPTKKTAAYPYTDKEIQDIIDFYAPSHSKGLVVHRLNMMADDDESHVERDLVNGDEDGFNLFDPQTTYLANKLDAWDVMNASVTADNSPDQEVQVPPYADKVTQTGLNGNVRTNPLWTTVVGKTYRYKVWMYAEKDLTTKIQLSSAGGSGFHDTTESLAAGVAEQVIAYFVETVSGSLRIYLIPEDGGNDSSVWYWDHELYEI